MSSVCSSALGPTLRLYVPEAGTGGLSSHSRLSEVYYQSYVPNIELPRGNAADTRAQNSYALRLWVEITGDPPLREITQETCKLYSLGVAALPSIESQTTINKHCGAVQKVLSYAGPPFGRNYQNLDLIQRVPWIERPPKEEIRNTDPWTRGEMELMVMNVDWFTKPSKLTVPPAVYWRALFLLLYNTGMRIQETIKLEWSHVHGDAIRIPAKNRKGRKKSHVVELNEYAQLAISWMQGVHPQRVFPWPNVWTSKGNFFRAFKAYRKHLLPAHRWELACHAFRRLHNVELLQINERACAAALGHNAKVNAEAYVGRQVVKDAVEKLSQPKLVSDGQRSLSFD